MLGSPEQIGQKLKLGRIGRAHQGCVVGVERHLGECPEAGVGVDRIDARHHVRAGDGEALPTLDAETDNNDAHPPDSLFVARALVDQVDPAHHVGAADRDVAIDLAFERRRHRPQDRSHNLIAVDQHGERGIG